MGHKQKSSDSGITKSKNKIPLERFEQFAEFIEKCGYSIKYNQITHNFEFYGFDKNESSEHLAENVPSILRDKLKKNFKFEKLTLKSQFFDEGICLDPRDKDSVMQDKSKLLYHN